MWRLQQHEQRQEIITAASEENGEEILKPSLMSLPEKARKEEAVKAVARLLQLLPIPVVAAVPAAAMATILEEETV
jgi:hypothetical protein